METTCDAYMAKIAEIKIASENVLTTSAQIQTLVNELETIDNQLDTEFESASFPTSFVHLNKIILVEIERSRKATLQNAMESLIELRTIHADTISSSDTYENTLAFAQETKNIKNYVDNTLTPSCSCLQQRVNLIKKLSKKP